MLQFPGQIEGCEAWHLSQASLRLLGKVKCRDFAQQLGKGSRPGRSPAGARPYACARRVQRAVDWACSLGQQVLGHADEAAVTLAQHILIEPTPPGGARWLQ